MHENLRISKISRTFAPAKTGTLLYLIGLHRGVEQLVARQAHNLEVACSSPASATTATHEGCFFVLHPSSSSEASATSASAPATTTSAFAVEAFATSTSASAFPSATVTTSKEIQTVTDVKHSVRSDSVDFLVAPTVGVDGTTEVRLFVENVVPLEHHGEFLALEETLRELGIPQQLVGVERRIAIAALAVHVHVGREVGTPGEGDLRVATVVEVPRFQIT